MNKQLRPPYFDPILKGFEKLDLSTTAAFERHVHWGFWHNPEFAAGGPQDFAAATERLCRIICNVAVITDDTSVIDVGCGFGGTIASLNERFKGLTMVGVNIDSRQLELARKNVHARGQNSIKWVEADASKIPCSDKSFDVVLALESIFHFDRDKFFKNAKRVLKDGGNFTISDFLMDEKARSFLDGFDLFACHDIKNSYGIVDLTWSLPRYRELAASNGLSLTNAIDITINTMPTYDFILGDADVMAACWQPDFRKVTRMLQKACRQGAMSYQILTFKHA